MIKNDIETIRKQIIPILKKHKVTKAGIFGSYARGEQKRNSDIDILIDKRGASLLDIISIEKELEQKTKRKVDLLTYKGISPFLKESIMKEEVKIIS